MDCPDKDTDLKSRVLAVYHEHKGRYGYRRITDELHNEGQLVNHKKVQRIMRELGLKSIVRMKKYRSYKGIIGKIAPNILDRNFNATRPNETDSLFGTLDEHQLFMIRFLWNEIAF